MGSFFDVTLPPFLLAVMAGAVTAACVIITVKKLCTYVTQQAAARAVEDGVTGTVAKAALNTAKDVLADVISDTAKRTFASEPSVLTVKCQQH